MKKFLAQLFRRLADWLDPVKAIDLTGLEKAAKEAVEAAEISFSGMHGLGEARRAHVYADLIRRFHPPISKREIAFSIEKALSI